MWNVETSSNHMDMIDMSMSKQSKKKGNSIFDIMEHSNLWQLMARS